MSKKTTVLARGPFLSCSGYGEQSRFAFRALRERDDIDLYLVNIDWGKTGWIVDDSEERQEIDAGIKKTMERESREYDISVQVTIPNEFKTMGKRNIGYTAAVETDRIPQAWYDPINTMDKLVVTSKHTYDAVVRGENGEGYNWRLTPDDIVIVPPLRTLDYEMPELNETIPDIPLFMTFSQWGPRKNVEGLIESFVNEFRNEDVGLLMKLSMYNGSYYDRDYCKRRIEHILDQLGSHKCRLFLVHGNLTEEEIFDLYNHRNMKAYVTTSHGEGFGIPTFDAAWSGLPIIAPFWGGTCDYTEIDGKPMIQKVSYSVDNVQAAAVWEGVIEKEAKWCFPDLDSVRRNMRRVLVDDRDAKEMAETLSKHVREKFVLQEQYDKFYATVIGE
jgi:hypothetical protein